MEKNKGCGFGLFIGSTIKFVVMSFDLVAKFFARILLFFGLWLPALYAVFGLILFWIFGFNPFDFQLEGQLYISGFVACCICSLIITIRNLIVKPTKSIIYGYKKPLWQKPKRVYIDEEKEGDISSTKKTKDFEERPMIYYSKLEQNTLIHEFSDRFEIYHLQNNIAHLDRVEYKNNE